MLTFCSVPSTGTYVPSVLAPASLRAASQGGGFEGGTRTWRILGPGREGARVGQRPKEGQADSRVSLCLER